MNCIIGKNSNIVKKIKPYLKDIVFISHDEIELIDQSLFTNIFIFSWCFKDNKNNLTILDKLDLGKCIFISSVAVFSNAIRNQCFNYPRDKLTCENIVLNGGGKIVRFGIIDLYKYHNLNLSLPHTDPKDIVEYINNPPSKNVTNLFNLVNLKGSNSLSKLSKSLHIFSFYAPNIFIVQALIAFITKLFRINTYTYTADMLLFFSEHTQIGFGAIGSRVYDGYSQVVVSPKPDNLLNSNGFRGSRIGYYINGLNKYWHGVKIIKKGSSFYKSVLPFVSRKSPPKSSIFLNVDNIKYSKNFFYIHYESCIENLIGTTSNLKLAAGTFENTRLLNSIRNSSGYVKKDSCHYFSDHESGPVGTISTTELLNKKYLKKIGFIVFGRKIYVSECNGFMIDFRPYTGMQKKFSNLYNARSIYIIFTIFKRLNFSLINDAIYNKFGFCFYTNKFSAYIQIPNYGCVVTNDFKIFNRTRLSDSFLSDTLDKKFNCFNTFKSYYTFDLSDGIHFINHDYELSYFDDLLSSGKLKILGSPSNFQFNCFHHTFDLIDHLIYKDN